jgi:hypothetical protein
MPMTTAQLKTQQDAIRQYQALYDDTLRKVGRRARQPVLGESVGDYRRESLRDMKMAFLPQNHELYRVQMRRLNDDALGAIEPMVLAAVPIEANNPAHVPPGELRKVEELDDFGKLKTIRFIGESFIKSFTRPGRRVISFNTPNGPVDAGGRFLRR